LKSGDFLVQSPFIPKKNSLKKTAQPLETKTPIGPLEKIALESTLTVDRKEPLIPPKMSVDPQLTLAIQNYEKAMAIPSGKLNSEQIINYLKLSLDYLKKVDPKTETVKYYYLSCYLYIFQSSKGYDNANEVYTSTMKFATELKREDVLVFLNFRMSALASFEADSDPSDKKRANQYLDLSIEYLDKALLVKPNYIYSLLVKASEYTKKIGYCDALSEQVKACDNMLSILQKAIAVFRLNKDYNCIKCPDFNFINIYHKKIYIDDSVKSNIFNLKDTIDGLNLNYKNSQKKPSRVQQLMLACDLMIDFFKTPDLWDELPHSLVSKALITRIKLNKKFHPDKTAQIAEDTQILKTLDLKEEPAVETLTMPLIRQILQESEEKASEKIKTLFEIFKKAQKTNDSEELTGAIELGEKIINGNIFKNINEKSAIKNAAFLVNYVNQCCSEMRKDIRANAYGVLGHVHYQHKNYKEALVQLNIAIEDFQDGDLEQLFLWRAKIYKELNNIDAAAADCKKILSIEPFSTEVYAAAKRFLKTLSDLQRSNEKKAALLKSQKEQEAAFILKKLSPEKKSKNPDLFTTTPDRVKLAESTVDNNLNKAILLLTLCKDEYAKIQLIVEDLKTASLTSLVDKVKNHVTTIETQVDTLKKYKDNLQEAIKSTEKMCIERNTQQVEKYAEKANKVIENSPKQVKMAENILKDAQKIKAQIQNEKELILQKILEQRKIKVAKNKEKEQEGLLKQLKLKKIKAEREKEQEQKKIIAKQIMAEKKEERQRIFKEKIIKKQIKEEKLQAKKLEQALSEEKEKIAFKKRTARAIAFRQASDFNYSVIPKTVFNFLFSFDKTLKYCCNTHAYLYGSSLIKLALGNRALTEGKSENQKLVLFKKIEANDYDITITSPTPKKINDEEVSEVETALEFAEWSTSPQTVLFQQKPRKNGDYPPEFTNYMAFISKDSKPLEVTVTYPGYQSSHRALIALVAIKAYFANEPHFTHKSLKISTGRYLIIEDTAGFIEKTFTTGYYEYQLPDPDDETDIHTGIFARAFGFYFKMEGILKPDPQAEKILKTNEWAHYFFARKFFTEDKKHIKINECYKEMEQLIRKNVFSKKELTGTIVALSNIVLLYTYYKKEPLLFSEVPELSQADHKQDGANLKKYCDTKKLTVTAEKITAFLQHYYEDPQSNLKFSELFPYLLENTNYLDKPQELIQYIKGVQHSIKLKKIQELIDAYQIDSLAHHKTLCQFFENFLFKNLNKLTSLALDKIPMIAEKLAKDTQAYYKIESFLTTKPTEFKTIINNFLVYPLITTDEKEKRNTILLLPNRSNSTVVSESNIIYLLKIKISFTDIEPFLAAYCDKIRKTHCPSTTLPEKVVQLRQNMMYFIFNYFDKNPKALDQFDSFFSELFLPNLKTLIDSSEEAIHALISRCTLSVGDVYYYNTSSYGPLLYTPHPPHYSKLIVNEGSSPLYRKKSDDTAPIDENQSVQSLRYEGEPK